MNTQAPIAALRPALAPAPSPDPSPGGPSANIPSAAAEPCAGPMPHGVNAVMVRSGKVRTAILLWALGVPIPIILVILVIRGCVS